MKTRFLAVLVLAAAFAAPFVQLRAMQAAATTGQAVPVNPAPFDRAALEAKIDELVNAHVKMNRFSGTVLLASAGKPLVAKGYGHANIEWQVPNTTSTRFRIGSVTKQFTSMLIMQFREQGKVKLEDAVCVYVTPCPPAWKPVTIHHLLTHTSGIPTYTGIASWRETNMVPKTIDQMVAVFRDLPLQWTPGDRYEYNNSGYFLLGVVIEKIAGKKYEQALQEMIFTPLEMKDTGYDWSKTILPRRASGYTGRGAALENAAALDMQQPYAAGSLYSTVEDLLTWDQALYTEKLLPTAAKQLMWTPFKDDYAYGWIVAPPSRALFGGHQRIAHSGGINGFSSVIVRLPGPNVTVIVLANNDSVNASAIGRDMAAIYYGLPYTIPAARAAVKVDPNLFDQYAGKYELRPGFVVTITREGTSLMAQGTGQPKFEILPESDTKFFAANVDLVITFVKGADGKVTHFVLTQGGRDQIAKRIE
ncbi:MAG TPA: serine hydrolase [Vicinamibacterales bacterium]|nr:serine hydrolase [Vicinamibacterales bacterium]